MFNAILTPAISTLNIVTIKHCDPPQPDIAAFYPYAACSYLNKKQAIQALLQHVIFSEQLAKRMIDFQIFIVVHYFQHRTLTIFTEIK